MISLMYNPILPVIFALKMEEALSDSSIKIVAATIDVIPTMSKGFYIEKWNIIFADSKTGKEFMFMIDRHRVPSKDDNISYSDFIDVSLFHRSPKEDLAQSIFGSTKFLAKCFISGFAYNEIAYTMKDYSENF